MIELVGHSVLENILTRRGAREKSSLDIGVNLFIKWFGVANNSTHARRQKRYVKNGYIPLGPHF